MTFDVPVSLPVSEREIEITKETHQEVQSETHLLTAIPETDKINPIDIYVPDIEFRFDQKLKVSKNFQECTVGDQSLSYQN